jgi:hypothetical protein
MTIEKDFLLPACCVTGMPTEVKGYCTGLGRHLVQLALKRGLGRGHDLYCEGSIEYAASTLLVGAAQLRAPVNSNCWYTVKTFSAKSRGEL